MSEKLKQNSCLSCTDCGINSCNKVDSKYPEFCLTTQLTEKEIEKITDLYLNNEEVKYLKALK